MNLTNNILKVISIAIDFVSTLSPKEIEDIVNKNKELNIKDISNNKLKVKEDTVKKRKTEKNIDYDTIKYQLKVLHDTESATAFLEGLKLTNNELRLLAENIGIIVSKKLKKELIIDEIIHKLIVERLNKEAIRRGIMDN